MGGSLYILHDFEIVFLKNNFSLVNTIVVK